MKRNIADSKKKYIYRKKSIKKRKNLIESITITNITRTFEDNIVNVDNQLSICIGCVQFGINRWKTA